ncbi:hypothetical protein CPB83DRAFT_787625 [Crepidotus variabilis]|uniref:HNH domain-containing protein n=1 Tax=Crepidotus variabilis TaxID=179855 RepID=A0A9P6ELW5_9AGAR|nr:hypothetical protein CPB83DRAFT_787625 [Crepidotus variabilis]
MSETHSTENSQYSLFKDCVARRLLHLQGQTGSPTEASESDSSLEEFASYLAEEAWPDIPPIIQIATHSSRHEIAKAYPAFAIDMTTTKPQTLDLDSDDLPLDNVSPSFLETLLSYKLVSDEDDALKFLRKVIGDYIAEAIAPPPVWSSTRTKECEICEREVPLTYHHLIPRSTHAKVAKQGWHPESMLNSVAWLCRPCHSAVHGVAPNEILAKQYYTVELLLQREDIQKWQKYASKQRWGGVRRP